MSTYEANYTHKISSQKIGWYGQYTKESLDFCEAYSFDFDLDSIESLFGASGTTDAYIVNPALNNQLTCGSGVVLYSNRRTSNEVDSFHLGFLDNRTDEDGVPVKPFLLKPPSDYFEEFRVTDATEGYEEVIGAYKLTDIFSENHPVYKNVENGWYIFYLNGRYRLANALTNYTKGLTGQRNKPNGIFISKESDNEYAMSEGVEQLTKKQCKMHSRYLVRRSTGAYFERKRDLYLTPRTPRSLDEQTFTETTRSEFPKHLLIKNFNLSSANTPWIKYKTIVKSQSIVEQELTIAYDASASDECELTTPVYDEHTNLGQPIDGLVERYDARYMISSDVLDEPIQQKTILMETPPSTISDDQTIAFEFNSNSRNMIKIDNSVGSSSFNYSTGYSLYVKYKPTSYDSLNSVIVSKWGQTEDFVSPSSSFKLLASAWQVNQDESIKSFSSDVKMNKWNDLMIVQDPSTRQLFIYINDNVYEYENFPNMPIGNQPLIIGGFFRDTNAFDGFGGFISDVRIYSEVLDPSMVETIFNQHDYESNKKYYEIPAEFEYNDELYMDSNTTPSTKFASNKSSYIPVGFTLGCSPDLNTLLVGEVNETVGDTMSLTLNLFERNQNLGWQFKFEEYTTEYTHFYYLENKVAMQNSSSIGIYEITSSGFNRRSILNVPTSDSINPILTKHDNEIYLILVKPDYEINVFDITNSSNPKMIPSNIPSAVTYINKISVSGGKVMIYATGGNAYFAEIHSGKLNYTTVRNLSDALDMVDINLVEDHNGDTLLVTTHRGPKISTYNEMYKVAPNTDLDAGYIKIKKIQFNHERLNKHSQGGGFLSPAVIEALAGLFGPGANNTEAEWVVLSDDLHVIVPPYSEFGTELLELSSFGDSVISSGKNLFISCSTAFQNEDTTPMGIVFWYKYSEELEQYVFVSRIFDTSEEGRKNFGTNIYANKTGTELLVQSNYLDNLLIGSEIWFAQLFKLDSNNIDESNLKDYSVNRVGFDAYEDEFKLLAWYRFNGIYSFKSQSSTRERYLLPDYSGQYNHLNCYFKINPRRETFRGPLDANMTYRFEKHSHCNVSLDLENTSFSINVWYLVDNFPDDESVLLAMYDSQNTNSERGFVLYANGDFMVGTNLNMEPFEVSIVNKVNTWNMITLVYNFTDKQLLFYLNSKLVKTLNDISIEFDNNILSIGGITYTKNPFYGYLEDIKIYKKQLSEEDILYEFQKSWKFEWMKT